MKHQARARLVEMQLALESVSNHQKQRLQIWHNEARQLADDR